MRFLEHFYEKVDSLLNIIFCIPDGTMALVQFQSLEDSVLSLAKLHNLTPEGYKTKNNSGLCFSFSSRKFNPDQKSAD